MPLSRASAAAVDPGVVDAVSQDDRHPRGGPGVAQSQGGEAEAVAQRRAIVLGATDDLEVLGDREEAAVIEGQRAAGLGVAGEADQYHGVVAATGKIAGAADEAGEDIDRGLESGAILGLGRQIEGPHRARDVDHHHDGDALAADAAVGVGDARSGQGDGEGDGGEAEAGVRDRIEARPPADLAREQRERGEKDPPAAEAAGRVDRECRRRGEQVPRLAELERVEPVGHAASPSIDLERDLEGDPEGGLEGRVCSTKRSASASAASCSAGSGLCWANLTRSQPARSSPSRPWCSSLSAAARRASRRNSSVVSSGARSAKRSSR
jgi:hypothetical protein